MPEIVTSPVTLGLIALVAYLVGSVPFGIVMTRVFGLGDLRKIGSGNIGATNVLRTGNKTAAALTLLLDTGKGGVAVLVARAITGHEDAAQIAGLAAFIGHLFPVWVGFRGGKGVATFLGTLLALHWPLGLTACAAWVISAALTRISSAGALAAAASAPIAAWFMGYAGAMMFAFALGLITILRHHANIRRLIAGREPRIGQSRQDNPSA